MDSRTFAKKSNQTSRRPSSSLVRSNRGISGSSHQEAIHLSFQSPIENQTDPPLRQAHLDRIEGESQGREKPRSGNDFGRVSVFPQMPIQVQAKLNVRAPGDVYEQEADRVAEHVMRMPAPQLQRACLCGGECSKCSESPRKQKHVHTKHMGEGDSREIDVPPIVHETVLSTGQRINPAARLFLEPRLGQDFSQVRVHIDAKAADSAQALNAMAYTVGEHVVFGKGHYAPGTRDGRQLLAHELTHVMQQSQDLGGSNVQSNLGGLMNQPGVASSTQALGVTSSVQMQRQPDQELDSEARHIIEVAQRKGSVKHRAWQVVWEMLREYFPRNIDLIHGVTFQSSALGLPVELSESRKSAAIIVGEDFMNGVTPQGFQGSINEMRMALERIEIRMRQPARPATPLPPQSPEEIALQEQIHKKFGITIQAGQRNWTLQDLQDLQKTLGRLNAAELAVVGRFTFIREGAKPDDKERCGFTDVDRDKGIFRVQMWNECFGLPVFRRGIKSTQVHQFGKPVGQSRIQHEIGHTIEFLQDDPQVKQQFMRLLSQNRKLTPHESIPAGEPFQEAFAEAFGLFRTAPDRLKAANPSMYQWFLTGRYVQNIPPAP